MLTAFVFLNCELGTEHEIIDEMKDITGVSEAVRVSGVYDIVAKVSGLSREQVSKVVKKIRAIADIRSSLTMVVAEEVVKRIENSGLGPDNASELVSPSLGQFRRE